MGAYFLDNVKTNWIGTGPECLWHHDPHRTDTFRIAGAAALDLHLLQIHPDGVHLLKIIQLNQLAAVQDCRVCKCIRDFFLACRYAL